MQAPPFSRLSSLQSSWYCRFPPPPLPLVEICRGLLYPQVETPFMPTVRFSKVFFFSLPFLDDARPPLSVSLTMFFVE